MLSRLSTYTAQELRLLKFLDLYGNNELMWVAPNRFKLLKPYKDGSTFYFQIKNNNITVYEYAGIIGVCGEKIREHTTYYHDNDSWKFENQDG